MTSNLAPRSSDRSGGSGMGDRQDDHGERQPGPGHEDDVDRPAPDGEETHPPHRQQRPQHGPAEQREADQHDPAAPVADGDHEQPGRDDHEHGEQRQLAEQPREEGPADVERRLRHAGCAARPARSAARTTFCSSIARVIGPTPPGLGATWPATSTTSSATSPAIFPSTRLTPTSSTAAPGLTISAVIRPGTPAAATTMSAPPTWAARSRVPVWQSVTVAFSDRRVSSSPSGRPTVTPRPITTTSAPAIGTSKRRSSSTMPTGVQGSGPGTLSTSRPRLVGCSPSASFSGSIAARTAYSAMCRGSGSWTM